jgi:hypothetical protein
VLVGLRARLGAVQDSRSGKPVCWAIGWFLAVLLSGLGAMGSMLGSSQMGGASIGDTMIRSALKVMAIAAVGIFAIVAAATRLCCRTDEFSQRPGLRGVVLFGLVMGTVVALACSLIRIFNSMYAWFLVVAAFGIFLILATP